MGLGGKTITLGVTGLMVLPEVEKLSKASKQGKLGKQILASVLNVGKWGAIPAVLALANPITVLPCALAGLAGFVLPELIPDIDVTEEKGQGLSKLA